MSTQPVQTPFHPTQEPALAVRQAYDPDTAPRPEWIRGVCPVCGSPVVSNVYYCGGSNYKAVWECWSSLDADPTCNFRRVL